MVCQWNTLDSYVFIVLVEYESTTSPLTLCKNHMSVENLVLELWSKSSRPIRMQYSLNYNISQNESSMKQNFSL